VQQLNGVHPDHSVPLKYTIESRRSLRSGIFSADSAAFTPAPSESEPRFARLSPQRHFAAPFPSDAKPLQFPNAGDVRPERPNSNRLQSRSLRHSRQRQNCADPSLARPANLISDCSDDRSDSVPLLDRYFRPVRHSGTVGQRRRRPLSSAMLLVYDLTDRPSFAISKHLHPFFWSTANAISHWRCRSTVARLRGR
jgi:hypothetical protein